jgi:hypothetical protein
MLITFLLGLVSAVIFFIVAEIFGRSKHIGRWWTFFLLWGGIIIPGVIALFLSPNAKKEPFKGNVYVEMIGVILVVLGLMTFAMVIMQWSNIDYMVINVPIQFIIVGLYLISLGKGNVINKNPRFYFHSAYNGNIRFSEKSNEKFEVSKYHYYIRENSQTSKPLTYKELNLIKLNENTPIWRKGLENWVLAKDLAELESIIIYNPPEYFDSSK